MKRYRLSRKGDDHTVPIDEILCNVMKEETTASLWYRLESLYMTKILSYKLFMKKQFYSLRMKKSTPILQYRNIFNRILSDLLALEVMTEEDKIFLLLFSLPSNDDHLATTIIYDKEILELEDVKQMLQNNELMKR